MRLALLPFFPGIGEKRVRRLMRLMGIEAFYPKPNLSKLGRAKYVMPYLLRGMSITRANQVWSTDITYIPMPCGHAYLYAVIDVFSRKIMWWGLYTTLEANNAIEVVERAVALHGKPEIINSDQGSQYTSAVWLDWMKDAHIRVSMDGRGRCRDNAWIERFWRTLKVEYTWLHPYSTVGAMRNGIAWFIDYYNKRRRHSAIDNMTPDERYLNSRGIAA